MSEQNRVTESEPTYCGFITLCGRPNVGKSSLLNQLIGKKLCITSHKPQTTRHQIQGVKTTGNRQAIYVDTPGLHHNAKKALNRYMNKVAKGAIFDVDAIVFMIEAMQWTQEDESVLAHVAKADVPVVLAINKTDKVVKKEKLLPFIEKVSALHPFAHVLPISVWKNSNIETLEKLLNAYMPPSPFYFPKDALTNQNFSFQVQEVIREKLMRTLQNEVPYATTVQLEEAQVSENLVELFAVIWVERESQRGIVIGHKGERLKEMATAARLDLEKFLNKKICLKLWVKVKDAWASDAKCLPNLGYSLT